MVAVRLVNEFGSVGDSKAGEESVDEREGARGWEGGAGVGERLATVVVLEDEANGESSNRVC